LLNAVCIFHTCATAPKCDVKVNDQKTPDLKFPPGQTNVIVMLISISSVYFTSSVSLCQIKVLTSPSIIH